MADKIIKRKKRTGKARPHFYKNSSKDASEVKTKTEKKKDKKARGVTNPTGEDVEPSGAARERVARMKERRRQLSASEYAASRALASKIAHLSSEEQADWLWQSYQNQSTRSATPVEREGLTAEAVCRLPPGQSFENGLKFLEPNWGSEFCSVAGREVGHPSALYISSGALGALEMIRACPDISSRCQIAKLFAKHIKLPEQAALLSSKAVCIGAGTPNRIARLVEDGVLKLKSLKWIIIDVRLDAKQRSILDMPEVRDDWWALWERYLWKLKLRIVLYGGQ